MPPSSKGDVPGSYPLAVAESHLKRGFGAHLLDHLPVLKILDNLVGAEREHTVALLESQVRL